MIKKATDTHNIIPMKFYLPLRLRKAGRVWCGGAGETHWVTCHNGVTPSKTKKFLKSHCFFRFNGKKI